MDEKTRIEYERVLARVNSPEFIKMARERQKRWHHEDIDAMIELAIATDDKLWFIELVKRKRNFDKWFDSKQLTEDEWDRL
jgi:hypothetical protein